MSSDKMFRPNDEQLELLKRWYAPDVSKPLDQEATNAFGMTAADIAKQQSSTSVGSVEEQEHQAATVTAQDLEQIRHSAHQEGQEQGYKKGHESGLINGHDEGYQQGLEQGKLDGHQQGYDQGKSEVEAQLSVLNQLVAQLHRPLDQQEQQIEQALLTLALDVAKKIVHTEVTQSPQPIIQAIGEGVKLLATNESITIRLHPQDLDRVQQVSNSEQLLQGNLLLAEDLTLSVGSCTVESNMSNVEFDLTSRIAQVFDDFHSQPKPPRDSESHNLDQLSQPLDVTPTDDTETANHSAQACPAEPVAQ